LQAIGAWYYASGLLDLGQRKEFHQLTMSTGDSELPAHIDSDELRPTQSEKIAQALLSVPEGEYGANYRIHLLEQYKQYLNMADKISDRRSAANTFFLTINTALLSAFGIANLTSQKTSPLLFIVGSIAAIVLSYSWYRLVRAYRDLNTAKFKVVHEIENNLPIRPFEAEWEAVGRGKDKRLYYPFTHIENKVPFVFILLYVFVILYSIRLWYRQ
jgi:hypothetical protein